MAPQYFVYTGSELLGYSLLERGAATVLNRSGRFYPDEDYYKYAETLIEHTEAMNDNYEEVVKAAYLGDDEYTHRAVKRYEKVSAQVAALNLFVADERGRRLRATEVRIDDYTAKYGDADEVWLEIVAEDQEAYDAFFS